MVARQPSQNVSTLSQAVSRANLNQSHSNYMSRNKNNTPAAHLAAQMMSSQNDLNRSLEDMNQRIRKGHFAQPSAGAAAAFGGSDYASVP